MSFVAKSIILDIATNWGDGDFLWVRSIEFKLVGVLVTVNDSLAASYATTYASEGFNPSLAFDTSLSKTGVAFNFSWSTSEESSPVNQRLICVFDTPIEFDEIIVNNGHHLGGFTTRGAQDVVIHKSSDSITSTNYGEAISNSVVIFDSTFTKHPATDTIDDQSLTLLTPAEDIQVVMPAATSVSSVSITVDPNVFDGTSIVVPAGTSVSIATVDVAFVEFVQDPVILYFFILTGAPDGEEDVQIPIKSWQGRHRSGDPSYLSVTIPGEEYSAAISARPNGEMVVRMAKVNQGTVFHTEEIMRVSLEEIRLDGGGLNKSITLTGHGTASYGSKIVPLEGVTFASASTGKLRIRAAVDIFLRPGDTATYGVNSFTVDNITYTVSVDSQVMEVAE